MWLESGGGGWFISDHFAISLIYLGTEGKSRHWCLSGEETMEASCEGCCKSMDDLDYYEELSALSCLPITIKS